MSDVVLTAKSLNIDKTKQQTKIHNSNTT